MSASVSASASSNFPSDARSGPLRRLSQLRAYTQNHFSSQSSSSSSSTSNTNSQQPIARRHTFSSRVSWFSPASSASTGTESAHPSVGTNNPAPCPDSEPSSSTLARYSSVLFPGYRGFDLDLRSQNRSSESSTSPPSSHEPRRTQTQGRMARLRGLSQTPDTRPEVDTTPASAPTSLPNGLLDCPDPVTNENSSSPRPKQKATIRFFPHQDSHGNSRPSLPFIPISRTLPSESSVIRVGRYSERDGLPVANPTEPSDAPVGFKSKVVSRKHCEFLYLNGQWHLKDVGSSSGTFLNHMRLSQPNMASRLYTVKDGDIVQLGIDFRGGEEMIFRCVRIRIECNRSWQQQPNEFNKNTESLIKNLGKGETADYSGCRECSICLGSVLRPYQCLFMAACAHVWHYKCVSRLIHTPDYPMFQCPNCRAYTDLSAEVDDSNDYEEVEQKPTSTEEQRDSSQDRRSETRTPQLETNPTPEASNSSQDSVDALPNSLSAAAGLTHDVGTMHLNENSPSRELDDETPRVADPSPVVTGSIGIPVPTASALQCRQAQLRADTPVRSESSDDNPLTPRNDSGPLVFDGRASMS
ncbi:FHA domain protein [Aspergillus parasiticus SU-1]|uniref:FHA domain protein n=1 Tax=Aspergillus parasiticus (strain ATCC 56775 / NRRL 5862 / SRRC 143 / SU-1) TaxID=1403190 RepID=A0A0F0ILD9_ASPPU|nr:FHA domain protein [Aspergillus parasiticus SU-1]